MSQYQIGLSTCEKSIREELFAAYQQAGIKMMELSLPSNQYDGLDYTAVERWARSYGVDLWSFHLPFSPFSVLDPSKREKCDHTVAYFSKLIDKASAIGITRFVVHPSGEPIAEDDRPARMACAKESLARLADYAATKGAVMAVEDLPRTCLGRNSEELLELLSAHEGLRVCFDTNHLLTEDPVTFIRRVGKKIVTTHVSDYDLLDEKHWLPGEGKLDWTALIQALDEIGYEGVWLYELGFTPPKTLSRPRDLTCEDIVANAKGLFEAASKA